MDGFWALVAAVGCILGAMTGVLFGFMLVRVLDLDRERERRQRRTGPPISGTTYYTTPTTRPR